MSKIRQQIEKLNVRRDLLRKPNLFKKMCPYIRTDQTCTCCTAPNISTRSWRECFSLISSNRTCLGPSTPIMKRTFKWIYELCLWKSIITKKKLIQIIPISLHISLGTGFLYEGIYNDNVCPKKIAICQQIKSLNHSEGTYLRTSIKFSSSTKKD